MLAIEAGAFPAAIAAPTGINPPVFGLIEYIEIRLIPDSRTDEDGSELQPVMISRSAPKRTEAHS